jgi:hypothetical protein
VKYLLSIVVVGFGLAGANPCIMTWINEFSTDTSYQFVELHAQPLGWPVESLNGARLITSTSECTLDISMPTSDYVVIDSLSLALGWVGNGTFRLRTDSDFIRLVGQQPGMPDNVVYPCTPTGLGQSLAPPPGGSSSFWNYDYETGQNFNWYIDSTPTPGEPNEDYSTISGSVKSESGYVITDQSVYVFGRYGSGQFYLCPGTFVIGGLGAGRYFVQSSGTHDTETVYATWPESVDLGYDQTVSGINLAFGPNAVTDSRPASGRPTVGGGRQSSTVVHGVLTVPPTAYRSPRTADLLDVTGRKVLDLKPGANDVSRLSPGVYFVWSATTPSLPAMSETLHSIYKVVLTR